MTTKKAESSKTLKRRAEEKFKSESAATQNGQSLDEASPLLHELRVHQIELEMQNEELRRAQEELCAERARYFDLYDLAPVGYITLSEKGLILESNLTAATLLGMTRSALNKQPITRFIIKEDRDSHYLHCKQLFETGDPLECELRVVKMDGTTFWARLTATAAQEADGTFVSRMVLSDISKRKKAEELLRESEERYRMVVEDQTEIICRFTEDGTLIFINDVYCHFFGKKKDELLGNKWYPDVFSDDVPIIEEQLRTMSPSNPVVVIENRVYSGSGEVRWMQFVNRGFFNNKGRLIETQSVGRDITERKRAEDSLLKSEERYHRITDGLTDYLYSVRIENGRALETTQSAACEKVTGYTAKEFAANPNLWIHMVAPEDLDLVKNRVHQILEGMEFLPIEHRIIRKDGDLRWVRDTTILFKDASGNLLSYDGVIKDITEDKLVENNLRCALAEAQRFREALDHVSAYIYMKDTQSRYVYANRAVLELFGCSADELVGCDDTRFFPQDTVKRLRDVDSRVFRGEKTAEEIDIRTEEAAPRIYWEVKTPIYEGPWGHNVCGLLGISTDITERKFIDETLRENNEKFSVVFDKAPVIITLSRIEDGIYLDVNQQFTNISGFSKEEAVGKSSVELGLITKSDRDQIIKILKHNDKIQDMELNLHAKSGDAILCEIWGEIITVGGLKCLISIALDVTEHRRVEQQLQHSQKMEAIGLLAGGIAHDFNNILTVIIGRSSLMKMDIKDDNPLHDGMVEVIDAAERAAQLTKSLLAFSRKQISNPDTVDLNSIVRNFKKLLIRIIGEDIKLKMVLQDEPLTVHVDTGQIEQVIMNMAVNARDAMPKGGLLTIETIFAEMDDSFINSHGYGVSGGYAVLMVTDNGVGMDDETLTRMFEPFYTTKEVGKGTGLGLSMAYGIVKHHNGYINVTSEPGKGSSFSIYIPVILKTEETVKVPAPVQKQERGTGTILIAEDEPAVRNLVALILIKFGYKVIHAENGREAVEKFEANQGEINLVMMDVIMPEMSGMEAFEEIKRLNPDIKILFITGYTADYIMNQGELKAGDNVLMKPVKPLELIKKVNEMLGRKKIDV